MARLSLNDLRETRPTITYMHGGLLPGRSGTLARFRFAQRSLPRTRSPLLRRKYAGRSIFSSATLASISQRDRYGPACWRLNRRSSARASSHNNRRGRSAGFRQMTETLEKKKSDDPARRLPSARKDGSLRKSIKLRRKIFWRSWRPKARPVRTTSRMSCNRREWTSGPDASRKKPKRPRLNTIRRTCSLRKR